ILDVTEESTCFLPIPTGTDPSHLDKFAPLTPTTTNDSDGDQATYYYTDTLRGSQYGESRVDSFLEDGGLRVSAKMNDPDDLFRCSHKLSSRSYDSPDLDFDWIHPFPKAPRPASDASRLDCLDRLDMEAHIHVLQHDQVIAKHVQDAMRVLGNAPIGSMHIVFEHVVYNLACTGYSAVFDMADKTVREEAACTHGILHPTPLVVLDTSNDARFRAHPLAVEHNASAYVSVPVFVSSSLHKECIGTIDIARHEPLSVAPSAAQLKALQTLATSLGMHIERRCAEFSQVHHTNRGRRHTAPIVTIDEDVVISSTKPLLPTSAMDLHDLTTDPNEILLELWERVMQTSRMLRATVSR
ncbi:hypothetical protein DYB32_009944, partial [Aphanomyces invadans]